MKKNKSNVLNLDNKYKRLSISIMKPFANHFILLNPRNRAKKNRVNLNYWNGKPNLGDAISPVIVNYMLEKRKMNLETPVAKTNHLYAVGSVITAGIQNCVVWGSGVLYTTLGYRLKNRNLDIRSVRGPLTRMILMEYGYDVPKIYGDPAMLLPEIYNNNSIKKEYKYGLIMHKNGSEFFKDVDSLDGTYRFIDIKTNDYKKFVDELLSVEYVISSSLHGIILAESYGIPAILVKPEFSMFKYMDWYYSTNRTTFPIIESLSEIQNCEFPEIPNLAKMREQVKNAFPYDIFDKKINNNLSIKNPKTSLTYYNLSGYNNIERK